VADSEKLGIASVPIRAELDQLDKDLDKANQTIESKLLKGIKDVGGKIASIGAKAIAGGIGVATGALVALGAAGWKSANELDGAYDAIAIGTGATGEELQGLKSDFNAVFKSVPTDPKALSGIFTALNSNLNASGTSLQKLATPLSRVTDMMGGDGKANAEALARAMQNWGVPVEEGAGLLDKFFVASQNTGVSIEELMSKTTSSGASLRTMGFSLDESIALLGGLEQAGVSSEEVMAAMKRSVVTFAEAGIPMNEGLAQTIERIKGAATEEDALNIAMDVFGTRAGPAMVKAIQEGRLGLGTLEEKLGTSEGAILSTAAATDDWGQKLDLLKQRGMLALAPLGDKMMDLASAALDKAGPALDKLSGFIAEKVVPAIEPLAQGVGKVVEGLGKLAQGDVAGFLKSLQEGFYKVGEALGIGKEKLDPVIEGFRKVADTITNDVIPVAKKIVGFVQENLTPILAGLAGALLAIVVPAFVTWAGAAATAAGATIAALAPVVLPIIAIGAAVGLLVAAWERDWGGIRTTLTAFWEQTGRPTFETVKNWLQTELPEAIAKMAQWFSEKWAAATEAFNSAKENIVKAAGTVKTWFGETLPNAAEEMRSQITEKVNTVTSAFKKKFVDTMDELNPRWREDWELVKKAASEKLEEAKTALATKLGEIKTKVGTFLAETKQEWSSKWEEIRASLAAFGSRLISAAGEAMAPLLNFIRGKLAEIKSTFTEIDWGSVGRNIINGIKTGLMNAVGGLAQEAANAAARLLAAAKNALLARSPSQRAADEIGEPFIEGIILGLKRAEPALFSSVSDVMGGMSDMASGLISIGGLELEGFLSAVQRVAGQIGQAMNGGSYLSGLGLGSLPQLVAASGDQLSNASAVTTNWTVNAHYADRESETSVRDTIRGLQLAGA